ncbi:MAG: hypothetical protein PHQ52_04445, partial [Candidatus Omnitrophica bacterium]|nr:hypothetical protein [Candidatus Omnitrophota bacterium]
MYKGKQSRSILNVFADPSYDQDGYGLMIWHRRNRRIFKVLCLFISFIFFFEQIAFSQGSAPISSGDSQKSNILLSKLDVGRFAIPRNIGITKDAAEYASDQTIINIKDAHDNFSAQLSIYELLDNLITNYEFEIIAVEGSSGYIDTSVVSSFPNPEIKKAFAEKLMKQGMISASEFYSIMSNADVALYGVDNKKIHAENLDAFRDLLINRPLNEKNAEAMCNALIKLEPMIYSKDLILLEENSVLQNNGKIKFSEKWETIKTIGEKNNVYPNNYENINNLLKAIEVEKQCNFTSVNTEREKLFNKLKDILSDERLEDMILKSLAFKLQKISAAQFYTFLVDAATLQKMDMSDYKNLELYVTYMSLYEGIDISCLKDEVVDFENRIKEKLFTNNDQKKLSELLYKSRILKALICAQMTTTEVAFLNDNMSNLTSDEFSNFIKENYKKYQIPLPDDLDINAVFSVIPEAEKFYRLTQERNRIMIDNTLKEMREKNQSVAALVTGGFHSTGIAQLLKDDKISHLVILPKFDKDQKRPYITIITNNKANYQELLDNDQYYIALESMFNNDAFKLGMVCDLIMDMLISCKGQHKQELIKVLQKYVDNYNAKQSENAANGNVSQTQAQANQVVFEDFVNSFMDRLKGEITIAQLDDTAQNEIEKILDELRGPDTGTGAEPTGPSTGPGPGQAAAEQAAAEQAAAEQAATEQAAKTEAEAQAAEEEIELNAAIEEGVRQAELEAEEKAKAEESAEQISDDELEAVIEEVSMQMGSEARSKAVEILESDSVGFAVSCSTDQTSSMYAGYQILYNGDGEVGFDKKKIGWLARDNVSQQSSKFRQKVVLEGLPESVSLTTKDGYYYVSINGPTLTDYSGRTNKYDYLLVLTYDQFQNIKDTLQKHPEVIGDAIKRRAARKVNRKLRDGTQSFDPLSNELYNDIVKGISSDLQSQTTEQKQKPSGEGMMGYEQWEKAPDLNASMDFGGNFYENNQDMLNQDIDGLTKSAQERGISITENNDLKDENGEPVEVRVSEDGKTVEINRSAIETKYGKDKADQIIRLIMLHEIVEASARDAGMDEATAHWAAMTAEGLYNSDNDVKSAVRELWDKRDHMALGDKAGQAALKEEGTLITQKNVEEGFFGFGKKKKTVTEKIDDELSALDKESQQKERELDSVKKEKEKLEKAIDKTSKDIDALKSQSAQAKTILGLISQFRSVVSKFNENIKALRKALSSVSKQQIDRNKVDIVIRTKELNNDLQLLNAKLTEQQKNGQDTQKTREAITAYEVIIYALQYCENNWAMFGVLLMAQYGGDGKSIQDVHRILSKIIHPDLMRLDGVNASGFKLVQSFFDWASSNGAIFNGEIFQDAVNAKIEENKILEELASQTDDTNKAVSTTKENRKKGFDELRQIEAENAAKAAAADQQEKSLNEQKDAAVNDLKANEEKTAKIEQALKDIDLRKQELIQQKKDIEEAQKQKEPEKKETEPFKTETTAEPVETEVSASEQTYRLYTQAEISIGLIEQILQVRENFSYNNATFIKDVLTKINDALNEKASQEKTEGVEQVLTQDEINAIIDAVSDEYDKQLSKLFQNANKTKFPWIDIPPEDEAAVIAGLILQQENLEAFLDEIKKGNLDVIEPTQVEALVAVVNALKAEGFTSSDINSLFTPAFSILNSDPETLVQKARSLASAYIIITAVHGTSSSQISPSLEKLMLALQLKENIFKAAVEKAEVDQKAKLEAQTEALTLLQGESVPCALTSSFADSEYTTHGQGMRDNDAVSFMDASQRGIPSTEISGQTSPAYEINELVSQTNNVVVAFSRHMGKIYITTIVPYTNANNNTCYAKVVMELTEAEFARLEPVIRNNTGLVVNAAMARFEKLADQGQDVFKGSNIREVLYDGTGKLTVQPIVVDMDGSHRIETGQIKPIDFTGIHNIRRIKMSNDLAKAIRTGAPVVTQKAQPAEEAPAVQQKQEIPEKTQEPVAQRTKDKRAPAGPAKRMSSEAIDENEIRSEIDNLVGYQMTDSEFMQMAKLVAKGTETVQDIDPNDDETTKAAKVANALNIVSKHLDSLNDLQIILDHHFGVKEDLLRAKFQAEKRAFSNIDQQEFIISNLARSGYTTEFLSGTSPIGNAKDRFESAIALMTNLYQSTKESKPVQIKSAGYNSKVMVVSQSMIDMMAMAKGLEQGHKALTITPDDGTEPILFISSPNMMYIKHEMVHAIQEQALAAYEGDTASGVSDLGEALANFEGDWAPLDAEYSLDQSFDAQEFFGDLFAQQVQTDSLLPHGPPSAVEQLEKTILEKTSTVSDIAKTIIDSNDLSSANDDLNRVIYLALRSKSAEVKAYARAVLAEVVGTTLNIDDTFSDDQIGFYIVQYFHASFDDNKKRLFDVIISSAMGEGQQKNSFQNADKVRTFFTQKEHLSDLVSSNIRNITLLFSLKNKNNPIYLANVLALDLETGNPNNIIGKLAAIRNDIDALRTSNTLADQRVLAELESLYTQLEAQIEELKKEKIAHGSETENILNGGSQEIADFFNEQLSSEEQDLILGLENLLKKDKKPNPLKVRSVKRQKNKILNKIFKNSEVKRVLTKLHIDARDEMAVVKAIEALHDEGKADTAKEITIELLNIHELNKNNIATFSGGIEIKNSWAKWVKELSIVNLNNAQKAVEFKMGKLTADEKQQRIQVHIDYIINEIASLRQMRDEMDDEIELKDVEANITKQIKALQMIAPDKCMKLCEDELEYYQTRKKDLQLEITQKNDMLVNGTDSSGRSLSKVQIELLKKRIDFINDFLLVSKEDLKKELNLKEDMLQLGTGLSGQTLAKHEIEELKKRIAVLKGLVANEDRIEDRITQFNDLNSKINLSADLSLDIAGKKHDVLIKSLFSQDFFTEQMDGIKSEMKEARDNLKEDSDGNYSEKSQKELFAAMQTYQKFLAGSCADGAWKFAQGYANGLYEVQLLAGMLAADGFVINMGTGEGKTEFSTVPSTIASMCGLKTFLETSNINLARKDFLKRKRIFDFLGIKTALFDNDQLNKITDPKKKAEYLKQRFNEDDKTFDIITVDTQGYNFFLADQLALPGGIES